MNGPQQATLLGRDTELGTIAEFFGSAKSPSCLLLWGDPGIGKTTLWEAGIEKALSLGYSVLSARTSEAEAGLPFAGLSDLVEGIGPEVLASLPAPQLHALEVALGRAAPSGASAEAFAVPAGLLSALRALVEQQPLLIAVDDVQWLDQPSAVALIFAARRLSAPRLRYFLSRRPGTSSSVEKALRPAGVQRLTLGALSFGAIARLLTERLGAILPRRLLRRIYEASQGNPLFAIELGRMLLDGNTPGPASELPIPDVIGDLFGAKLGGLAGPVRRVLLAVALSAGLSLPELSEAVDPSALDEAIATGLVVVERSHVRPAHPMLAAAARQHAGRRERRELHRDLASCVADPTLRARHLALAAPSAPDEVLATTIASAAQVALQRGAVQEAEELAAHALRFTPEHVPELAERVLTLARCHVAAGEPSSAERLLTEWMEALPPGRPRAEAHLLLTNVVAVTEEEGHIELALAEAGPDLELRAMALAQKVGVFVFRRLQKIDEVESMAQEALDIARSAGADPQLPATSLAWARALGGRGLDDADLSTPEAAGVIGRYDSSLERPYGVRLAFRGNIAQARETFVRVLSMADQRGEVLFGGILSFQLCELELRAGNAHEAARLLGEIEPWLALEDDELMNLAYARLSALLGVVAGRPEDALRWARKVLDSGAPLELLAWERLEATRALGLAALFEHDARRVVERLWAVWDYTVREHIDDPGAFPVAPTLVEALVECGEEDMARKVTERLYRLSRQQAHPWGLASAKRCMAVVQTSRSYDDAAAAAVAEAADEYGSLGLNFDRALSLLWLGGAQRRARKRSDARRVLEEAEAEFARAGCTGWADRVRSELSRLSGKRPGRSDELSPSERRVAALLARGLSNKEIAEQLFVSVNTVETHLSHAYAKLGVRSRGQLVHRLAEYP